jgi:flavin reductase (DIM6/NTAB) family NADH-FMN oxidoreductase RutF
MDAEQEFQKLVGALDYPIFIVTAAAGDERDGCVVGFATQTSIKPPLFLVGISEKNRTYEIAKEADVLVVHLVPESRKDLAEQFGGKTGDEEDKLSEVEWVEGPDGAPRISGLDSWFAGEIRDRLDLHGDHAGYLLAPVAASSGGEGPWLGFQAAKDIEPGHEP